MKYDLIILGAGASGLTAAAYLSKFPIKILVIEKSGRAGKKLLASGGGKANFTNLNVSHLNYISNNNDFCRSALARFSPQSMIDKITENRISFEERENGQLFCKKSSSDILNLLLQKSSRADFLFSADIFDVSKGDSFFVKTSKGAFLSDKLLIATGSGAYPQLGATEEGMLFSKKFGHKMVPTRPGLVPLRIPKEYGFSDLSGISFNVVISNNKQNFNLPILFTHTGISGPSALQISNYWTKEEPLFINFLPGLDIIDFLRNFSDSRSMLGTALSVLLPSRFIKTILPEDILSLRCSSVPLKIKELISSTITKFEVIPSGTEGYKKAEISLGGVDLSQISPKSFESKICSGLFFAGEVMDVAGQLGGFNLQWAYSSAMAVAVNIANEFRVP